MKLEKKHYIWAVVIIALILIFIFRKQLMKAAGFSDSTIRKFCGGGIAGLGYGRWYYPSGVLLQPTPAINEDTQSIYRISCEDAHYDGTKWCVRCNYPGLTGNFYQTTGYGSSAERATARAIYQLQNNFMITTSRPIPEKIPGRPVN